MGGVGNFSTRLTKLQSFVAQHNIEPLSVLIHADKPISIRFRDPKAFKRVAGNAKCTDQLVDECMCQRVLKDGFELLLAKGQSA